MSVQTAASAGSNRALNAVDGRKEVDRNTWPEGKAAVIAPRTEGGSNVLRAVVDPMRIGVNGRRRRGVRSASDRLMVNTCWLARTLRRQPVVTVVIGEG